MGKLGTTKNIKKTIDENKFNIKKKFGQNFLTDQNILSKIANVCDITKETLVIEIGPGLGSLTEHLLKKSKRVLAYEIDSDLIPILKETFAGENLTLVHKDILKSSIDEDIKELNEEFDNIVVVANLPYYITTPIIMKVLEESSVVKEMVLMMQMEVARRLTSDPSTKDYNSLSIAIQYKTVAKLAIKVPRTVFIPAPNVDSAIVHLKVIENREITPVDEKKFYKLVRSAFGQRRKTLVNNYFSQLNIDKTYMSDLLEELGYDSRVRAESLSVEDFIRISDNIKL